MGEGAHLGRITGVCIGAQTANQAQKHGIPTVVAREATLDALVQAVLDAV